MDGHTLPSWNPPRPSLSVSHDPPHPSRALLPPSLLRSLATPFLERTSGRARTQSTPSVLDTYPSLYPPTPSLLASLLSPFSARAFDPPDRLPRSIGPSFPSQTTLSTPPGPGPIDDAEHDSREGWTYTTGAEREEATTDRVRCKRGVDAGAQGGKTSASPTRVASDFDFILELRTSTFARQRFRPTKRLKLKRDCIAR